MKHGIPPAERFWLHVDKSSECWIWLAHKDGKEGYGRFFLGGVGKHSQVCAHRFAYELVVGPIPAGFTIDHLCQNPACVRPEHLEPVTIQETLRRARKPQTPFDSPFSNRGLRSQFCKRGHEVNEQNVYIRNDGYWNCRLCQRETALRRKGRVA